MPALTEDQKAAFIKWMDTNPEALRDLVFDPEAFFNDYYDASQRLEAHGRDYCPAAWRELAEQDDAWKEFQQVRKVFFPGRF